MKPKLFNTIFIAGLFIATIAMPCRTMAGGAPKESELDIYNESADASKQISDALAIAKKDGKRVLLQFGANWCVWCHRLHKLFESDKTISEELKADYVVALIDVNKGHNKDLITRYQAEHNGLPFIVILDSDGKHLKTKDSGELEEGDHHSPEKVMVFLKEWAPKK
jgi:thioredoxin-related protein